MTMAPATRSMVSVMRKRAILALPVAPLFFAVAACSDSGPCGGSPLMPLCEPAGALASPPEPQLVFQSNHEGVPQIYTMNSDGTGLIRLTHTSQANMQPRWSPDGTEIVFASERDGRRDIYLMSADGSDQRNLSNHEALDGFPDWSPDGSRIVFHSARGGVMDIWVMDRDGGNLRQLTDHPNWDLQPRFSPDGRRIAFVSERGGMAQVFVMNADGSNARALTDEGFNQLVSWSPDGRRIAFMSMRAMDMVGDQALWQIYIMNADGSGPMNLTRTSSHSWAPSWSSTNQLYFTQQLAPGRFELRAMEPDGNGQRQVTDLGGVVQFPHSK
jgi:Tol biopolymer transport system component